MKVNRKPSITSASDSGKSNELDRITRLVDDLNYTIIESDAEFRTYELKEADPEGLAKAILDIYSRPEKTVIEDGKPKKVPQPPKVVAVPDLRTRSVIIRAEALDFEYIEVLVENLDKPSLSQVDMKFYELRNAKPEDAVNYLQEYFEELKVTSPGEILDVRPDTRTKSVVVLARPDMFDQISKIIKRIDVPPAFAEAEVEIVELRKANAENLAQIIQTMLRPDASQGGLTDEAETLVEQVQKLNISNGEGQPIRLDLTQPIKIFGESGDGVNRVLLTSTAENMIALKELVKIMDTVSVVDGVTIRIVALSYADAENVRGTLDNIFSQSQALGQGPGGRAEPEGSGGKALVNELNLGVDDRTNSIIMSGDPDTVDLAERMIADLDKDVENFVTDVKIIRLKHASIDQVLPMLQSVFNENSNDPSREGISRQVTRLRLHLQGEGVTVSEAPAVRDTLTIQGDDRSNTIIVAASAASTPSGTVGGFGACASVARGGRFSKTSILMFWLTLPNDLSTFLVGKLTGSLPTIFRSLSVFVVAFSLPLSAFRKPPFRPDSGARASFASSPPSPVRSNASVVPKSSASTLCAVQQNMSSDAFRYTLRFLVSIRYFPSGLALLPAEDGMDFWARSDVAQSGQPHRPALYRRFCR